MKKFFSLLILIQILFLSHTQKYPLKCASNIPSYIYIVQYEYGLPILEREDDFNISYSIKILSNHTAEIVKKKSDKYETYKIKIETKIYDSLIQLVNEEGGLKKYREKEKLEHGAFYGGVTYNYLEISDKKKKESICWITPLMSAKFNKIIEVVYEHVKNQEKVDYQIDIQKNREQLYKKIVPLHKTSNMPQIKIAQFKSK